MKRSIVPAATPARVYLLFAIGFGLAGAVLALAASLIATPKYEAQARLYVSTLGGAPVSNASYQETAASQQIALSLAKLVPSEVVTVRVIQSLQLDMSPSELASNIEATVEPETVLINLKVTDPSPTVAREVANATAFEFSDFVEELQVKATPSTPKPQVTLIQPAVTPNVPISPNVPRNVGLGALAGLMVGLVLANLRERANRTVRDVHSLQHIVGQPPLGSIPISRSRDEGSVAGVISDKSVLESFKEVRTNLQHVLGERPTRIVCITSAGLGEGKTTTVLGIAIALADAGHRVVVVDSDLRRPDLSRRLKLTGTHGLTEALSDGFAVGDVTHPSALPGIDAISSGHASHQPSELLNSDKAVLLFCLLGERYDFVLIDTPALLAFTDAAVVAGHTDGVVLVAPYAHVESDDLQSAVASLHRVEARILGPVFTFAPVSESRSRSLKPRRSRMKSGERHLGWLVPAEDVEDDVVQHGSDSSRGDAQLEDDVEPLGEPVVEVGHGDRQDFHAERDADDVEIRVAGEIGLAASSDARGGHSAELPHNGTAQPALDTDDRYESEVLGDGIDQEAVEDAGEHGEHVGSPMVIGGLLVGQLVDDLPDGQDAHQHHDQQRNDRSDREHWQAGVDDESQSEAAGLGDAVEVGQREGDGQQRAEQQTRQDRDLVEEAWQEPTDQRDDQQGEPGEGDVLGGAEDGLAHSANSPANPRPRRSQPVRLRRSQRTRLRRSQRTEITADQAEVITADQAEVITADQAEEITADQAEEITADQAERESQGNTAGTEQNHDRETETSMDYRAEPDYSWPLLEDKPEFEANGAADNHALDRHARSR